MDGRTLALALGSAAAGAGLALLGVWLAMGLGAGAPALPQPAPPAPEDRLVLTPATFADLPGWDAADVVSALTALRRSCVALLARPADAPMGGDGYAGTAGDWHIPCRALPAPDAAPGEGRAFFETAFRPFAAANNAEPSGLFTGYYEPEIRVSDRPDDVFSTPLYPRPADLVMVELGPFREALRGQRIAGRVENGRLVPYEDRAAIAAGALEARGAATPLLWSDDPVGVFFLEIQGSGRGVFPDGRAIRLAYAGQNGHPYTAVGRVLIDRGAVAREAMSMQAIRTWMEANPAERQALMNANASYVFFEARPLADPALGADGAKGVALTPEASLAVDLKWHALGVPMWLSGTAPAEAPGTDTAITRLMIAQDTGGAIRGPVRGDVYWGHGPRAEAIAGRMRHRGLLWVLLPVQLAERRSAAQARP